MIGRAIYELLTGNPDLNHLVEGRVRPARFAQGEAFPCIQYTTDSIRKVPVRDSTTYEGTLVLDILAETPGEIDTLVELVRATLDDFDGTAAGFTLAIDSAEEAGDEEDIELGAFYKSLEFDVTVTKQ